MQRGQLLPCEGLGRRLLNALSDQGFAKWRMLHEAGREIHIVAQGTVCTAGQAAIGAGPGGPLADADLHLRDERHTQVTQFQCGGYCANSIVFVGHRRAERSIQMAAFVADHQLQHVSAVAGQNSLHGLDEGVQL